MARGDADDATGLYPAWKRWWQNHVERAKAVLRVKRRIRQMRGVEPRSRVEIRRRSVEHGGWHVSPESIRPGDRVYSFGVGRDLRLERALVTRYDAEVFAFDPTPSSLEWVQAQTLPRGLHHVPVAIAAQDGHADLNEPTEAWASHSLLCRPAQTGRSVRVRTMRLSSILEELGHPGIDHLKLDVEGAEYPAIEELLRSQIRVKQLLVEFHHRFPGVGPRRTERTLRGLYEAGYRIFHISPEGKEYSLLGPAAAEGPT